MFVVFVSLDCWFGSWGGLVTMSVVGGGGGVAVVEAIAAVLKRLPSAGWLV